MEHWIYNASFYHIYPLGFCDAPEKNNLVSQPVNRLEKIYDWIDHIIHIGSNALYLGPLFESTSHGYDTVDYYNVDRRLGDNDTLKNLVQYLHNKNIKIVLDGVFNHVGRDFWAFKDVQKLGMTSNYCNWFYNLDFNKQSQFGDSFYYEGWNGYYDLVKLNLNNPNVIDHIFQAVRIWIKEFGIDGLRLDAADFIQLDFLKKLSKFTKEIKPDFWLMGEVVHGDYRNWANHETLDSTTNYECYKGLYSSHNDKNYFEIAYSLNRLFGKEGIYKNLLLYNFVDNHDVTRVASILKNSSHIYPLHILLFTMPGIPSIYYGSEFFIKGEKTNSSDKYLRPSLQLTWLENNKALYCTIKNLSAIRKQVRTLQYGNYKQLFISHEQFAFSRQYESEIVVVVVNSSSEKKSLEFNVPLANGTKLRDVLNNNEYFTIKENKLQIEDLWQSWGRVLIYNKND